MVKNWDLPTAMATIINKNYKTNMKINIFEKSILYCLLLLILLFITTTKQVRATVGDYTFFTRIATIQRNSRAKATIDDEEIIVNKTYDNVNINFGYDVNNFEVYSNYEYNYYNKYFKMNMLLVALGVNYLFKFGEELFTPYIGGEFGFNFSRFKNYSNDSAKFSGRSKVFKLKTGFEIYFLKNTYIDANIAWETYSSKIRHIDFLLNQRYTFKYSLGIMYRFR